MRFQLKFFIQLKPRVDNSVARDGSFFLSSSTGTVCECVTDIHVESLINIVHANLFRNNSIRHTTSFILIVLAKWSFPCSGVVSNSLIRVFTANKKVHASRETDPKVLSGVSSGWLKGYEGTEHNSFRVCGNCDDDDDQQDEICFINFLI